MRHDEGVATPERREILQQVRSRLKPARGGAVAAVAWSCVMSRVVLGAVALIAAGWTTPAAR